MFTKLEAKFADGWLRLLNDIAVTQKTPGGKLDFITITQRSFNAFYSSDMVKLPVSDGTVERSAGNLPLFSSLYANGLPTREQIQQRESIAETFGTDSRGAIKAGLIPGCTHSRLFVRNRFHLGGEGGWHHSHLHLDEKNTYPAHLHYLSAEDSLKPKDVSCLLEQFKKFNKITGETVIRSEDVISLKKEFERQYRQMRRKAGQLAKGTLYTFIVTAIVSFFLDLFSLYLLPLLLEKTRLGPREQNIISGVVQLVRPFVTFVIQTLNIIQWFYAGASMLTLQRALMRIPLTCLEVFGNYVDEGDKMWAVAQFFKIVLFLQAPATDKLGARELGVMLGTLLGGASARGLGKVLFSKMVGCLPKLKED